jgi:hypothetical protein
VFPVSLFASERYFCLGNQFNSLSQFDKRTYFDYFRYSKNVLFNNMLVFISFLKPFNSLSIYELKESTRESIDAKHQRLSNQEMQQVKMN